MNTEILLGAAAAPAIITLCVVLLLGRRIDRLEESLMDLRPWHATMQEAQTDHVRMADAMESLAAALPDLNQIKDHLRDVNGRQSDLISTVAKVSTDMEEVKDIALGLTSLKPDLARLLGALENHYSQTQTMHTTIATLPTLHAEQRKLYKILKVANARLKDMEQTVAAVPSIQVAQTQIQHRVAEWNSALNCASEALSELLQSEELTEQVVATAETPTGR